MTSQPARRVGLHPRNRHQSRYDFPALVAASPALEAFVRISPRGEATIDFADPLAVRALNQALLACYYQIAHWDIPEGFLCPPVPGRADYLHHLADLLAEDNQGEIPTQADILDIGTGANCIYPLIGQYEYGWRFTGSEVNPDALRSAAAIVAANPGLNRRIRLRRQKREDAIFRGIIHTGERYAASVCNPPFHDSAASAGAGSERKRRNLGLSDKGDALNFGGQPKELWCEGGEVRFIQQMIEESGAFARQVGWFTTLVSRGEHLPEIYRALQRAGAVRVVKKSMAQGQKQSRFIGWSFSEKRPR